jgi:hypothetical protein
MGSGGNSLEYVNDLPHCKYFLMASKLLAFGDMECTLQTTGPGQFVHGEFLKTFWGPVGVSD